MGRSRESGMKHMMGSEQVEMNLIWLCGEARRGRKRREGGRGGVDTYRQEEAGRKEGVSEKGKELRCASVDWTTF